MSGIVGVLSLDGAPVSRDLVRRLTDSLASRGPDAQRVWVDGSIGFGHTLLRTTHEAAQEQQPLGLDDRLWIVADARIDARQELTDRLSAHEGSALDAGATPDVGLILRAYRAWGIGCLDHLLGDFCFAIWDERRRTLFCARDHLGIRPFYYARVGNTFIFSNSLACVRAHPLVSRRLNEQAVGDTLLFRQNYDPATTFFAAIRRLPPAHLLTITDGVPRRQRYWALRVRETIRYRRASEYVAHFRDLLRQAVADRLRTDAASILLSGGLDSTSVAAVAVGGSRRAGRAFHLTPITGLFEQFAPDREEEFARAVADAIGVTPRLLHFAPDTLGGIWKRPECQPPEPQYQMLTLGLVLRRVGVDPGRVLLFGHGDVAFIVSPHSVGTMLRESSPIEFLVDAVRAFRLLRARPPLGLGIRDRLQRRRTSQPPRPDGAFLPGYAHPLTYPTWLDAEFERDLALRSRWNYVVQTASGPIRSPHAPAYSALASPHEANFHEWLDPGVSGLATEIRMPFLDLRLLEYVLALPTLPWSVNKGLLRIAMRGTLPRTVLERPKTALPRNPFQLLLARDAEPLAQVAAMPELRRYVDRDALLRLGDAAPVGWTAPIGFRLMSLGYWLRAQGGPGRA